MNKYLRVLILGAALQCNSWPALANFAISPSGPTTLLAIDAANQGTSLCAAGSTECGATVPISPAGAPLFTSAVPGLVTLTGTNNVNNIAGTISLPTGAATQTTLAAVLTALGTPMQASGGSVTANAGTNLNTSLLALEAGGNLATLVTDTGAPGATACTTDTASCNQNQQMQRLAQRLTTINTTLGTPFQAGGSIGNTTFAVTNTGTFAVQAASTLNAETTKVIGTVRNLGNAGAIFDGATGAAVPANVLYLGANNAGNLVGLPGDGTSGLWVNIKAGAGSGGTALTDEGTYTQGTTSFTPAGCTFNNSITNLTSGQAGAFSCTNARSLHTTVDNTNANGQATMANSSPVVIASNQSNLPTNTAQVNGVTVLTGTGATGTGAQRVTVSTDQATNAGAALVKGGVGVVNGGSFYEAVAASQTAAVLQSSTGAAGDYLSHCVIYPTSTSPGVVTVFDSTNTAANSAVLFPGGSTSTSNLVPFAVPVGAISVNGAWKVTTGANVSAVCFGKFS